MDFRLHYALRGLIIVIGLLVLRWSFGPLTRSFLQRSAPETLGYELSIDQAYVSPLTTEMELETVRLPHPSLPLGNWLECQHIWLDVEGSPLLRKKLVIRNARAVGVHFHDPTSDKNFAADRHARPAGWDLDVQARHQLSDALSAADLALQPNNSIDLKSDVLLEQIAKTWPTGMFELDNEFTVYELQHERLVEIADALAEQETPDKEEILQTHAELQSLEQRILAFRKRVSAMHTQCEVDQKRFEAAQADDVLLLQSDPQVQLPDKQTLSHYFLGAVSTEQTWEVLRLLQASRAFYQEGKRAPEVPRSLGITFDYPREDSIPTFLLKALHFEGAGDFAGKPIRFAGSLQNLTNNPRMYHQPTRLVIDAHIPHRVVIEAVIDQTQNPPQEHVVIRCPNWPQPARTLGDAGQVAIATSPCVLSMRAELHISAGEVTGSVQTRHQKVGLKPHIAEDWGGERVAHSLTDLLGTIQTLDCMVNVEGKLTQPQIEMQSPLGEQLAGGLQHGFEQELAYRFQQRMDQWRREQQTSFAKLQEKRDVVRQRLISRMSETGGQVITLSTSFQQRYPGLAKAYPQVATQKEAGADSPVDRK